MERDSRGSLLNTKYIDAVHDRRVRARRFVQVRLIWSSRADEHSRVLLVSVYCCVEDWEVVHERTREGSSRSTVSRRNVQWWTGNLREGVVGEDGW